MFNKIFTMLVIMFAVIALSSCDKKFDEVLMDDTARIAQIHQEIKSNPEKYLPTQENFLGVYDQKKNAGLKNASISPKAKVGFTSPTNDIYLLPNGEFKQILVWAMIDNDYLIDKGIIAVHYNEKYEQINDWEFFMGWENNEYCVPVYLKSNFKNVQTRLTFSFPVNVGQLSFETFSNCQDVVEIWLPELNFDFSWETCGGASFGGLKSFNPYNQNEINIQIGGVFVNTNDYIKFSTKGVIPNTKININISDENGNWVDRTELIFPFGKLIPEYIMIPLTFTPYEVFYQTITFEDGRAVYSETIQKKCVRMISIDQTQDGPRIYGLK